MTLTSTVTENPHPVDMDLACKLMQKAGAPPILSKPVIDELAVRPPLPPSLRFPPVTFTRARKHKHGETLPQTIAHRGYKTLYPENTMAAFRSAIEVGVHALETDVHITKDQVVVLSHDATLMRCFGVDKKIIDCEWEEISKLRTRRAPHEPMPRLRDLLHHLAEPPLQDIWLLLDIKIDNNADDIMRLMAEEVKHVKPSEARPWEERIVLGCWAAKFIPLCHTYFPGFPVTNIGFSIMYSRQFLEVPNVSFNMLQATLVSPSGRKFIKECKARGREIYSWTVNDEKNMDWCIRKGLDGVITDDPKKFIDLCDRWTPESKPPSWEFMTVLNLLRINLFAWIFGFLFWQRHGFGLDAKYLTKKGE